MKNGHFQAARGWLASAMLASALLCIVTAGPASAQKSNRERSDVQGPELSRLIDAWQKSNDADEQVRILESALALEPKIKNWPLAGSRELVRGVLLKGLGDAYQRRKEGEHADNIERAIVIYARALAIYPAEVAAVQRARTEDNLAIAYSARKRGDRADNLRKAIAHRQAAIALYPRPEAALDWAKSQYGLGVAYRDLESGSKADNMERAIAAYTAALSVMTREGTPEDWALAQFELGTAYDERVLGTLADNIERAIKAYEAALTVYTHDRFPTDWAWTQNNLGNSYKRRVLGDRADNIEKAIGFFEAALTQTTRVADPRGWAETQNNLANAYTNRIRGRREENLEKAIAAYEASLTVLSRENFPERWATTQNNLGTAYIDRVAGDRADNVDRAIKAHLAALSVLTRENAPRDWAHAQANLGAAYLENHQGDVGANRDQVIAAFEAALTVLTKEAYPQDWAQAENNLGAAYYFRINGGRSENLEKAIGHYRAARSIYTREAYPHEHLRTGRFLAKILLEQRNWRAANAAYADARKTFALLFGQGLDENESTALIQDAGALFPEGAYAAIEAGEAAGALDILSQGKARLLAVALRQQTLDLSPEQQARHIELKDEIREWDRILASAEGLARVEALERLGRLRGELLELIERATRANKATDALALAGRPLSSNEVIVAPIVTSFGGKLLVVTPGSQGPRVSVTDLPQLTGERINDVISGDGSVGEAGGWLGAFQIQYLPLPLLRPHINEWFGAIQGLGPKLWEMFGQKLQEALAQQGVKPGARLIWLPVGALGLLPVGLSQDPASGQRLGDTYEIIYAPSLNALAAAARWLREPRTASLAATVNPTGEDPKRALPFTEIEGAMVAAHFTGKPSIKLDKTTATPEHVLTALKDKSYWHFSSHGSFDWEDVRQSGLVMRNEAMLTIGRLLETEGSLGHPRLVALSACETGLYDISRNPDEFVGLPATFMQVGAIGVLSSLWQVDDLATALLMAKVYALHLGDGLTPPAALRGAQQWLRNATRAEILSFARGEATKANLDPARLTELEKDLKSRSRTGSRFAASWEALQTPEPQEQDPQLRLFAHPYYWAGFIYTGL